MANAVKFVIFAAFVVLLTLAAASLFRNGSTPKAQNPTPEQQGRFNASSFFCYDTCIKAR